MEVLYDKCSKKGEGQMRLLNLVLSCKVYAEIKELFTYPTYCTP